MLTMTLTTADLVQRAQNGEVNENDDPSARPRRRSFTAAEKRAHLNAYDELPKGSEARGAYLRREGLYSSHISEWRRQRDSGTLDARDARDAKARSSKAKTDQAELARARRRIEKLETELERTKIALEITGKAHALLELISESADTDERSKP